MSNIYLNFDFLNVKKLPSVQFWEAATHALSLHSILKFLVATSISDAWEEKCVWLFHYFHFESNYGVLKSKSLCILLNKNINFDKNETESKMENPTHSFRDTSLVPQLIIRIRYQK